MTTWAERVDCAGRGCYAERQPDWSMFVGCFGATRVRPSDIDGVLASRDHDAVLFLEWKHSEGGLPNGQRWMLSTVSRLSPATTVVVVYGDDPSTPSGYRACRRGVWDDAVTPVTLRELRRLVASWWESSEFAPTVAPPPPLRKVTT